MRTVKNGDLVKYWRKCIRRNKIESIWTTFNIQQEFTVTFQWLSVRQRFLIMYNIFWNKKETTPLVYELILLGISSKCGLRRF